MEDAYAGLVPGAGESRREESAYAEKDAHTCRAARGRHRRRWGRWALVSVGAMVTVVVLLAIAARFWHRPGPGYDETPQARMESFGGASATVQEGAGLSAGFAQNRLGSERKALVEVQTYRSNASTEDKAPLEEPAEQGPLIARNVSLTIVVKDIANAHRSLEAMLARVNGYAAQSTVSTPENDAPNLQASLRIPVSNLPATMNALRGLGRVVNESESGDDVGQQHADLEQRLKTARNTEDRLRAILQQRTGSISDILQVEEEIARVRGAIEGMEADRTNLQHRVDFATVDVSLTEASTVSVGGSGGLAGRVRDAFVAGYRHAAATVIGICLFLLEYGAVILLWIAILAIPAVLLRRWYRRARAKA